jgi:spore coat polysaccharide biosynthesis protein SpsF
MKTDCIIQARLASTRFPRKIFAAFNGRPLIRYIVDHLQQSENINRIIIATTVNPLDDELCQYCEDENILFYRGSEENVLKRFIETSHHFDCQDILRVCSDNPFIDIAKLNQQIELYFAKQADYCTFAAFDGTPIILKPIGLFAEMVSTTALNKAFSLANEKKYFEHVTFFIYSHPEIFHIEKILLPEQINTDYRFTIDYPEDLQFCQKISDEITTEINLTSIMRWMEMNAHGSNENLTFSRAHEKVY